MSQQFDSVNQISIIQKYIIENKNKQDFFFPSLVWVIELTADK